MNCKIVLNEISGSLMVFSLAMSKLHGNCGTNIWISLTMAASFLIEACSYHGCLYNHLLKQLCATVSLSTIWGNFTGYETMEKRYFGHFCSVHYRLQHVQLFIKLYKGQQPPNISFQFDKMLNTLCL